MTHTVVKKIIFRISFILMLLTGVCSCRGGIPIVIPIHGGILVPRKASSWVSNRTANNFRKFLSTASFDNRSYGVEKKDPYNAADEYVNCYSNTYHHYYESCHQDVSPNKVDEKKIRRSYYEKGSMLFEEVETGFIDYAGQFRPYTSGETSQRKIDFSEIDCSDDLSFAKKLISFYLTHYDLFKPYETAYVYQTYGNNILLDYSGKGTDEIGKNEEFAKAFPNTTFWNIGAECDKKGRKFRSIVVTYSHDDMQSTVSFDSLMTLLQSEHEILKYEYEHGISKDEVPVYGTILEEIREKNGKLPYQDWWN